MSTDVYAEIFALAQCMPGPSSTQVSFAAGIIKKGIRGGLLSGALFQYPGAVIMTAVGVFAARFLANPQGWLAGLTAGVSAVGVAMVASAGKGMASKLCVGWLRTVICTVAIVVAYYHPKAYTFPALIIAGGLTTLLWSWIKKEPVAQSTTDDTSIRSHGLSRLWGAALLALWVAVLIVSVVLANALKPNAPVLFKWWESFFRVGSVIYGGGQVVLPMLYNECVQQTCDAAGACTDAPNTFVTSKQFYAGLGIVQALPGPLFNFAAYLGAIMAMNTGYLFLWGTLLAWFGLFAPGVMIIFGIMPFWGKFRNWSVYKRALPGLNAAGVGLIIASVFSLALGAMNDSPFPLASVCIGVLAFTAVDQLALFEPAVVLAGAAVGVVAWALKMV
jgi:chromate transporter